MAINLISSRFGSTHFCRGSGSSVAGHPFGARSGGIMSSLGILKLLVDLFAEPRAKTILNHFPRQLVGIWVIAADFELVNVFDSINNAGVLNLMQDSQIQENHLTILALKADRKMVDILDEEKRSR